MPCFSIRSNLLSEEIETMDPPLGESICQGWLTKSPPEKKMSGRIFPSKWRKRYFVLRMPPAASSLPGSWLLEYYDSPRCTKRYGSIDLDSCEEVTIHELDTYTEYTNLFTLLSKHKGRSRNYYLAAPDRPTMNHWVESLCKVCGFKPDDDRQGEDEWPHQAAPIPVQGRYNSPHTSTLLDNPSSMPDLVPRPVPASVHPSDFEHSPRRTNTSTGSTISQGRGTTLALDSVPPAPAVRSRDLRASVDSTDSVPDEQAPEPPGKTGTPRLPSESNAYDPTTYDHPRHQQTSYMNLPPQQNPEGTYQVPPHPTPVLAGPRAQRNVDVMLTKVPPAAPSNRDMCKRDSNSSSGSRGSNKDSAYISSEDHDQVYDQVPPGVPRRYSAGIESVENFPHAMRASLDRMSVVSSKKGTPHHHHHHNAHTESNLGNLNETVPAPTQHIVQPPYMNIPPTSRSHPSYENTDSMDPEYDVPPTRKDSNVDVGILAAMSPPPAPHMLPNMPHYINTPSYKKMVVPPPPTQAASNQPTSDSTYLPMTVKQQSEYIPMNPATSGYVPVPKSDRVTTQDYMKMSGDGNARNAHQIKTQNSMYVRMQGERSENDTYTPMTTIHGTFDDNYVPMTGDRSSCDSVYTDMSQPPAQQAPATPTAHSTYDVPPSNKPVPIVPPRAAAEPPRLQRHASANTSDGGLMLSSLHGTRSFKREVPRSRVQRTSTSQLQSHSRYKQRLHATDPPLPRKTIVSTGESSSSDEDDESGVSLDRSSDTLPSHKLTKVDMLSKKSLNSTPPPPKRPGEVQYLDLALESKASDTERSPVFPRSPPPPASRHHSNASPTEYKEIDFVKTKALTEVKKTVESKRKSSEKNDE